ncbi:hypothetical protein ZYGR_0A03990 [Zygosaccharomyces rouxii]|uniref:ZYRO0A09020p n=2 Tax=Zygosaccharomyces rouxii TaxID=4956 RepID=C5DQ66_ZYGRC|nr:uncharacterized protein ZYRO0A09020g [Zygosaccharomyces rouxii]KAH9198654.1 ER protein Pkr1-domain-containing protein [Zygosaccharomyces rouxii]GAV46802.1 hypothetical protein ZYGR_0A03990 [Zygosaccharomyces rouxii]CAR25827.1 ZYRO0A09020p [Zygosaccharomyces rouxii]
MSFFQNLWGSIFEPGTNPQLLIATHLSFTSLILVLVWLCYETRNVHFFALLTIAAILWALVTWFINELKHQPLRDNDQLAKDNGARAEEEQEDKKEKNTNNNKKANQESRTTGTTAAASSANTRRTKSRKT